MNIIKSIIEVGIRPSPFGNWSITPDDLQRIAWNTAERCRNQFEIPVYDIGYGGPVIGHVYAIQLSPKPPADPKVLLGMLVLKMSVNKTRLVQASVKDLFGKDPYLVGVTILRKRSNHPQPGYKCNGVARL